MRKMLKIFSLILAFGVTCSGIFFVAVPCTRHDENMIVYFSGAFRNRYEILKKYVYSPAALCIAALSCTKNIFAGEYQILPHSTPLQILRLLCSGKQILHSLTIPEGWSSAKIFKFIADCPVLNGPMPNMVENGTLWPSTYRYALGASRVSIIAAMQRECEKKHTKIWNELAQNKKMIWASKHEWVIFASLLEKEGVDLEDKKQVASVLQNRLKRKMRLELDCTVLYASTDGLYGHDCEHKEWLSLQETYIKSPYNTYRNAGLPPGPITNPGEESLRVAAESWPGENLYYQKTAQGKHVFAQTFQEHSVLKKQRKKELRVAKKISKK